MAEQQLKHRPLAHAAVEEAIRAIANTNLKPQAESMLRTFLAFAAIHADNSPSDVDGTVVRDVVREVFVLLPTPEGVPDEHAKGTLRLRGSGAVPRWMNNDSYRGAFEDYAGPSSPGRHLFVDEDCENRFARTQSSKSLQLSGLQIPGLRAMRLPP